MGSVSENIMSPLYLYNNKLLVKDGKLATSQDCCCKDIEVAIYICSNNNVRDDFFDVILNGKSIGQYQPPHAGASMLFVTDMNITKDHMCGPGWDGFPEDNPCQCDDTILFNKVQIQKEDFIDIDNNVRLCPTQDNSPPGTPINEGAVWVLVLRKDTYELLGGVWYGTYTGQEPRIAPCNFGPPPTSPNTYPKWPNPWTVAEESGWI
jgi:hypothetical protein